MSIGNYPPNYLLFNSKLSKNLALVLQIEGIPTLFGVSDTFTKIRYGDAGIIYGLPGVVYGGLRSLNQIKPYMMLDGGLNIQQRIEPEQGKGNIGQLTINLADYNGEVSFMLAPGNVVPEIMGQLCRLWIGYTQTSYPDDYVLVYQGFITSITCPPGKVILQISDSSNKTRQPIFDISSTTVVDDIGLTDTAIVVQNTGVLHQYIRGPDGNFDPTVSCYVVIDSEIMYYAPGGIVSDTTINVLRAQLGTQAATHSAGTTVNGSVGFGWNVEGVNCIELALKILLSGFAGPDFTNVPILSFVYDYNLSSDFSTFVLGGGFDALLDYGLTPGDWFYISNAANPGNNISGQIVGIEPGANGVNSIIKTNQTFILENPTSAIVDFRSQYDTLPVTCGIGCTTAEVDVATFQSIRFSFFVAAGTSNLRAYYDSAADGQDTIATDIMLPMSCYSISRHGRISMAVTKPPLPGNGTKLVQLDYTNIIEPDKIQVTRSTNQRSFYNEISYEYDFNPAQNTFDAIQYFIDTDSLNQFGYTVALPIVAKNVSAALGGSVIAQNTATALLTRFKTCLVWIELTVNWAVGSLLEVSDIVVLVDNGNLKIMNFETGLRDIGTNLFEVIDRNYQIVSGTVKLKLLGGLGFDLTSRFGLFSPSSKIIDGSTTTNILIEPSYGQINQPNEIMKWQPLIGTPIQVHDFTYTNVSQSVITNVTLSGGITVDPPLAFVPPAGYLLEIAPYPPNPDPTFDQYQKKLYAHFSDSIPVVTGYSPLSFGVNPALAAPLIAGNWVKLHNHDYSVLSSGQNVILGVTGGTVVLKTDLKFDGSPFTPDNTFTVEGIGFPDGTGAYLFI